MRAEPTARAPRSPATARAAARRFCAAQRARHGAVSAARGEEGARALRTRRGDARARAERAARRPAARCAGRSSAPLWLREARRGARAVPTRCSSTARERGRARRAAAICCSSSRATSATTDRWRQARGRLRRGDRLARETGPAHRARGRARRARLARGAPGPRGRAAARTRAEALELCAQLGGADCTSSGRCAALGDLELGARARRRGALEHLERRCARRSTRSASPTSTSRPRPSSSRRYLRLGDAATPRRAAARAYAGERRRRAAVGAGARGPRARACVAGDDEFDAAASSEALRLHAQTPDAFETRAHASSPTARACAARGGASTPASSCAPRSRPSSDLGAAPWADAGRGRARRDRRDGAPPRPEHARRADAAGAADRAAPRRGPHDARGRRGALPQPEDRSSTTCAASTASSASTPARRWRRR